MHRSTWMWAATAIVLMSAHARGSSTRTVEIPLGKGGEVQVAEIVARLARASDATLDRPPADLTLSTQGLARALTKTLLSETLGPDVDDHFPAGDDGDDD